MITFAADVNAQGRVTVDWIWSVLLVLGVIVLVDLVGRAIAVALILPVFERPVQLAPGRADPDPNAESIAFPTSSGLTLRGSLHRHGGSQSKGVIVFCPELGGTHWLATKYCHGLLAAGFDVFSFDFRNQGESDRLVHYEPRHWVTHYEQDDVRAALAYVRGRDDLNDLPVGLFGISRGGGAALAVAADNSKVRAVAGEGVFSTESLMNHYLFRWASLYVPDWVLKVAPAWHVRGTLRIARWVSQIRRRLKYSHLESDLPRMRNRPVLLIVGEDDSYVPPSIGEHLADCVGSDSCELWSVAGAKHNMARDRDPDAYDRQLVAFFETHMESTDESARPLRRLESDRTAI